MEFNTLVDDALPLDAVITPDLALQNLLEDMDKNKIKLWAFTNAYVTHAKRVLRLLGVEELFEGVTYCDYAEWPLVCKPMGEMFEKAEREAGVGRGGCFFVGMNTTELPPSLFLSSGSIPPPLLPPSLCSSGKGGPEKEKKRRNTTTYAITDTVLEIDVLISSSNR